MRALCVLPLLAACEIESGECTAPPAVWTLPGAYGSLIAQSTDGTLLFYIDEAVVAGSVSLPAHSLARIRSATGEILAMTTVVVPGRVLSVYADGLGGGVLRVLDVMSHIVHFGADLQTTWSHDVQDLFGVDAGPSGEVAYFKTTPSAHALVYLDANGVEQWSVPETDGFMRIGLDGGVYLIDEVTLQRSHYRATGQLLDDTPLPLPSPASSGVSIARDGSVLFLDPSLTIVGRIDAAGSLAWRHALHARADLPVATSTGQLLVLTNEWTRVVRLDAESGQVLAQQENCRDPESSFGVIVAGDADGFVRLDLDGLKRYPLP